MWLKNAWYQAGWSSEVTPGNHLVRTFLDEPVLLYRDSNETLHALLDRCPHRFAPFSAGKIEDDKVTCGYHGLAFGPDGQCVENPHGPVTKSMCVRHFPVEERYTAMWIWMGDVDKADPDLIPDLSFITDAKEWQRISGYMPTACNYELLTDNILDLSHADFLHPTSLGGIMAEAKSTVVVEGEKLKVSWDSPKSTPIPIAYATLPPETKRANQYIDVEWQAPAVMKLGTSILPEEVERTPESISYTLHNMIPETAGSTHYFYCAVLTALEEYDEEVLSSFGKMLDHAFQNEDKPMIEAQQKRIGDADFWELDPILLKTDNAGVRARRKLKAMIEAESR